MFISLSPFNITTSLPLHGYWYPGIIPFARLRFFWSPLGTSKWPRWDVHAPQWPSAMYCPDGRGGHGGPLVATTWQLITTPTTTTNNDKQQHYDTTNTMDMTKSEWPDQRDNEVGMTYICLPGTPNFDPQFWSCAVGFGCIKSRLKHLGDTEDLWRNSAVHREEAPWMIWAWRRCCDATMLSQSWRAQKNVTIPGPFFGQTRIWSEVRNFNTRFACGFPVLSWFCAPILFTSDRFLLVRFPSVGCSKRIFFGSAGNRGPKNITHYMSHA